MAIIPPTEVSTPPGVLPSLESMLLNREQAERLKNTEPLAPIEEVLFFGSSVDIEWKGKAGSARVHIGTPEILDILQRAYPNGKAGDPVAIAQVDQLFVPRSLSTVGQEHKLKNTRDQRKTATQLRVFQNQAGMLDYDPRERYELSKADINTALLLPRVRAHTPHEVNHKWTITMVKSMNGVGINIEDEAMRQKAQEFLGHLNVSPELKPWFTMVPVSGKTLERRIVFTPFAKPTVQ